MPIADSNQAATLTFDAAVYRALSRRLSDTPWPHNGAAVPSPEPATPWPHNGAAVPSPEPATPPAAPAPAGDDAAATSAE